MVEYTIDDIRGPTVAREMAQLKSFVLEKFNGAISDAEAAAAQAATDAANAVLDSLDSRVGDLESDMTTAQGDITTNAGAILALDGKAVKKTGESSQSIAGDISVSGALSAGGNATVGGNLGVTGQSVLSGNVSMPGGCSLGGSPTAPDVATGVYGTFIANANKVKAELDAYAMMVRTANDQNIAGTKTFTGSLKTTSLPVSSIPFKVTNNTAWLLAYSWTASNVARGITFLLHSRNDGYAALYTAIGNTTNGSIHNNTSWTLKDSNFKLAYNTENGMIELYTSGIRDNLTILDAGISNNLSDLSITAGDGTTQVPEPTVGDTYAWVTGVTP